MQHAPTVLRLEFGQDQHPLLTVAFELPRDHDHVLLPVNVTPLETQSVCGCEDKAPREPFVRPQERRSRRVRAASQESAEPGLGRRLGTATPGGKVRWIRSTQPVTDYS